MAFNKKIPHTPIKFCWSQVQFQKSQPTPSKTRCAPLFTESQPQIYSVWNFNLHENGQGLEYQKVTFLQYIGQGIPGSQAASNFSSPLILPLYHLAIFTCNLHINTFNMLYELFPFLGLFKVATSKHRMTLQRATSHTKVRHPQLLNCLFLLLPWENVN